MYVRTAGLGAAGLDVHDDDDNDPGWTKEYLTACCLPVIRIGGVSA